MSLQSLSSFAHEARDLSQKVDLVGCILLRALAERMELAAKAEVSALESAIAILSNAVADAKGSVWLRREPIEELIAALKLKVSAREDAMQPAGESPAPSEAGAVEPASVEDEDEGCPVGDPDCEGGAGDVHIACEAPAFESSTGEIDALPTVEVCRRAANGEHFSVFVLGKGWGCAWCQTPQPEPETRAQLAARQSLAIDLRNADRRRSA